MTGKEFWDELLRNLGGLVTEPAIAGTYYGTMGGTTPPPPAGPKAGPGVRAASGPADEGGVGKYIAKEAAGSIAKGPALSPGELAGQYFAPGGSMRTTVVWVIIILAGLIGVWGLIAPGGGVAIIERARR
jgi:hypothetical protein